MEMGGRAAALVLTALAAGAPAADLKPETVQAFERYIRAAEARIEEQLGAGKNFLWTDEAAARQRLVRAGEIAIERFNTDETRAPGGLIHDWTGAVFAPGVTLRETLALVQDYARHQRIYQPEVIVSRLIRRDGNYFKIHLRLLKKKVLTVVLNTEHDVRYFPLDAARCHSRSYSTRVAEVVNAGSPGERELPPGEGNGFLWRLYSYWRFQEKDGGVYIECRAISLTRDVPTGLGWLIEPIIRNLPRESLASTLRATRDALGGAAPAPVAK
ncbi:MAG: hypothetical protein AAB225_17035 [Acidobacteriota bacterium]